MQINSGPSAEPNVPFGGYKQSGIGRELGQYALDTCVLDVISFIHTIMLMRFGRRYTQVKAVHINLGQKL